MVSNSKSNLNFIGLFSVAHYADPAEDMLFGLSQPPFLFFFFFFKKQRKMNSSINQLHLNEEFDAEELKHGTQGLRSLSVQVLRYFQGKHQSTYREASTEIIRNSSTKIDWQQQQELGESSKSPSINQHHVKRRIYDIINVLVAMGVLEKERKILRWLGSPETKKVDSSPSSSSHAGGVSSGEPRILPSSFDEELENIVSKVNAKRTLLSNLLMQQILLNELVKRNSKNPQANEKNDDEQQKIVNLPFIVVSTPPETKCDLAFSDDKRTLTATFNSPFEIHDDVEILLRLNLLDNVTEESIRSLVPKQLLYLLPENLKEKFSTPLEEEDGGEQQMQKNKVTDHNGKESNMQGEVEGNGIKKQKIDNSLYENEEEEEE